MDEYEAQIKKNKQDTQIKNIPQDTVVEMKFLAVSWLDDFERDLFDGKTVSKLLNPQEI